MGSEIMNFNAGPNSWGFRLSWTGVDNTFSDLVDTVNDELSRQLQERDVVLLPKTVDNMRSFFENKIVTAINNAPQGTALKITIRIKIGRVTITIIIDI